ncbi:MAG: thiamine phosphate synthase [Phycisphaerales bacterium]|nr:MAG: thiamine phosphate synthase [Phycisphaerales bacterium]
MFVCSPSARTRERTRNTVRCQGSASRRSRFGPSITRRQWHGCYPIGTPRQRSRDIELRIARIIDANVNRAREAARVMEDHARFVLDDAILCRQAKQIRHALAAALSTAGLTDILRSRDIIDDVGRDIQTAREYDRETSADVVLAAGKRLSEALRVIEEYGKTASPEFGRAVEQLRYQGYELEKKLCVCIEAADRFGHVRLYVLLTESLCSGDWYQTAGAAIDGGADCIQLREKNLPDGFLLDRARRLSALCRQRGVLFIVNDRADIAIASGADGLHVGQGDLTVEDARRVLGPAPLVGISTHSVEQARAAADRSPDYVAVGPMFATDTKPRDHVPGPALIAEVRQLTSLPLVAVGGITPENVGAVVDAGARCVCACSAVISEPDVAGAARRLKQAVVEAGQSPGG